MPSSNSYSFKQLSLFGVYIQNKHRSDLGSIKYVDRKEIWVFKAEENERFHPRKIDYLLPFEVKPQKYNYSILRVKKVILLARNKRSDKKVLKRCETYQKQNRKTSGGSDFINTIRYFEKVDIEFGEEGVFVIVREDYGEKL